MLFRKNLFLVFILFFFSYSYLSPQNKKPIIDYVFLLDTSTSMIGEPEGLGYYNIFNDVKKEINNFIDRIEPPANVFVYEFNAGIQSFNEFEIRRQNDLKEVKNVVLQTKATGETTFIYRSLEDIIQRMNNYIENRPKEKHSVIIQLYTDGNDKDEEYTMEQVMNYFQEIKKEDNWWIFYTTLGIKVLPEDRKIIESNNNVRLYEIDKGEKPPSILIIENKISELHFGNLWEKTKSSQTALFKLPLKTKLPENLSISINEEFLNFPEGLGVIVNPDNFIPQKRVDFDIEIIGFSNEKKECEGLHEFNIKLISYDPFVQIVPDMITTKFLFEPPRIVEITPPRNEKFPINFGELHTNKKTEITVEKKINLLYNNQAVKKGGNITVSWEIEKSPTNLTSNNFIINNCSEEYLTISPDSKEMIIKIVANKDLKSGKYKGKINFISEVITISGKELKENKENPNIKYIIWTFEIPKKPISIWYFALILMIIAFIIFIIMRILNKPVVLSDFILDIKEPEQREIDLSGKNKVIFGKEGIDFKESSVNFIVYAMKMKGEIIPMLEVKDGDVYLHRNGESDKSVIIRRDKIFNGDSLSFENNKISIRSFAHQRIDNI